MKTRELVALVRNADIASELRTVCPEVGYFRARVAVGDLVRPGTVLGELDTLGLVSRIVAPDGARGVVTAIAFPGAALDYGALIAALDPNVGATGSLGAADARATASASAAATGLVFRAPTSGRFYGRSSPDKPPFVEVGSELAAGHTILPARGHEDLPPRDLRGIRRAAGARARRLGARRRWRRRQRGRAAAGAQYVM